MNADAESSGQRVFDDLLDIIARHGWAVRHVGAGSAPSEAAFSYTIGLTALGHPEVVIQGMPFESAQGFLNLVGTMVKDDTRFPPGTTTLELTDCPAPVVFIQAVDTSGLTAVAQVYGRVDAVQLVWPDSAGHLPWDPGYNNPPETQPLLGPRP